MKLKTMLCLPGLLLALHACDFGSAIGGGGGTGGEGLTLTGVIVNPSGVPVAGAKVRVYPEVVALSKAAGTLVARADSTLTDTNGSFRFSRLPSGRYNLVASIVREDVTLAVFVGGIPFVKTLNLGADTLRPAGSLQLRVRDAANAPLADAHCSIPGSPWSAVSNTAGVCAFTGVAPGVYRVSIVHQGMNGLTDTLTVASGEARDGGAAVLSAGGNGAIPANWLHVSALGYAFYIPPELEIQYEGYGIDSWQASYQSPDIRLGVGAGMIGPIERPSHYPEYAEEVVSMGDVTAHGEALLLTYRLPDSVLALYDEGALPYVAELQGGQYFRASCATHADQERAVRVLKSVRKWEGPGLIPVSSPAKPSLADPRQGDTGISVNTALSWYVPNGTVTIDYYRLQLATDSLFVSPSVNDSIPYPFPSSWMGSSLNRNVGPLAAGGRYYWRVVAVGRGGSRPSATRTFTTAGSTSIQTSL